MTNSLTMSFLFRKHTGTDNFSQRCSEILRDKKTGKFCSFLLCRRCTVLARSPQVHFQRSCFLDPFSEILRPASFLNVWCAVFSNQDSLSETFRAPRPQGWPPKSVLGSMKTQISRDFQRFPEILGLAILAHPISESRPGAKSLKLGGPASSFVPARY